MLEEQTSVRDQKHNLRTTAKWIYLTWGCKLMCGVCAKFSPSIKIGYQWMGVAAQCNVGVKKWVAHLWVAKQSLSRNHCYCTCWNRSKTVAQRSVLYVPNPRVWKGRTCSAVPPFSLFYSWAVLMLWVLREDFQWLLPGLRQRRAQGSAPAGGDSMTAEAQSEIWFTKRTIQVSCVLATLYVIDGPELYPT